MNRVLTVKGTILFEFQLFLGVPPVFAGGIISPLTLAALERNQLHHLFLACHTSNSFHNNAHFGQPSIRIELMTLSLPWICSAN